MVQKFSPHPRNATPPPRILPVLQLLKSAYILWHSFYCVLPKPTRYSLGQRLDTLFIHAIEAIATAAFLPAEQKLPFVHVAIRKIDTIKLLLVILWEMKSLENNKYLAISPLIEEVGCQLGGWNGQLTKQNSLRKQRREK